MYDFGLVVMRAEATSLSCLAKKNEETSGEKRMKEMRKRERDRREIEREEVEKDDDVSDA